MAKTNEMRSLTLALIALLVLSACGSSKQAASNAPAVPGASATQTGGATAAGTATVTAPATTPTTPSTGATTANDLCDASRLALSFLGQQGATGHGELGFALRNTGAQSCRTFGYPGIQFVDGSGAPLQTVATRTTRDFFGSTPEEPLVIAPGESFSFRIGVTHFGPGGADTGCTTAAAVAVIPPNDTASLHVSVPQGAYECKTATVSPVRPGKSAYP